MTRLTHDLSGLLDGSLRWMSIVERQWPDVEAPESAELERTREQLRTVRGALERMVELIAHAKGAPIDGASAPTVGEAIDHALDVVRPLASDVGVELAADIARDAGALPMGPLYSVILNGLRNAVESVTLHRRDARVVARAAIEDTPTGGVLALEIVDNGGGPPSQEREGVFSPGYTTRGHGRGHGLAIAREIVAELNGEITLESGDAGGATLRVRIPLEELS
ncbi:MAG: hypothetical protein CMJ31_04620 [Phycisphaerae bacterium]|nr:hypothetical protein [Phycisphaerae bacterium]